MVSVCIYLCDDKRFVLRYTGRNREKVISSSSVAFLLRLFCFAYPEKGHRACSDEAALQDGRVALCVMAGAWISCYITEVLTAWHRRNCAGGWLGGRFVGIRKGCCISSSSIKLYITSDNWHWAPIFLHMMPAYVKQSMLLHLHIIPSFTLLPRSNSLFYSLTCILAPASMNAKRKLHQFEDLRITALLTQHDFDHWQSVVLWCAPRRRDSQERSHAEIPVKACLIPKSCFTFRKCSPSCDCETVSGATDSESSLTTILCGNQTKCSTRENVEDI